MIDKEAIQEIAKMAQDADNIDWATIGDKIFTSKKLIPVFPEVLPESISVYTLQGLVDYINNGLESVDLENCFILVSNYYAVQLMEEFSGENNSRACYCTALYKNNGIFNFGTYMPQDQFMIELMTKFEQTEPIKKIIKYCGGLSGEKIEISEDDGITQKINMRKGIQIISTEKTTIENYFRVRPYRTFTEIEQPEIVVSLRIRQDKGDPEFCLFESANPNWKTETIIKIKNYLKKNIKMEAKGDLSIIG